MLKATTSLIIATTLGVAVSSASATKRTYRSQPVRTIAKQRGFLDLSALVPKSKAARTTAITLFTLGALLINPGCSTIQETTTPNTGRTFTERLKEGAKKDLAWPFGIMGNVEDAILGDPNH